MITRVGFRRLMIVYILVMGLLLVFLNTIYYYTMKNALLDGQKQTIDIMTSNVKSSLEITQKGEILFEEALSEKLQLAAIAAQNMLPPKLEDVTNEQLAKVRDQLGIEDLTLFKYLKKENNFVGAKSSDQKEIGLTTETWGKGKWNIVFKELMEKHEATPIPNFGENLPHFWAGPFDTSSADPTKVSKWGYYNDGTTDYLIDPYISENIINRFHQTAGVQFNIAEQMKTNPIVLEIGILNDKILQGEWTAPIKSNPEWHSERKLLYGTYNYTSPQDLSLAKEAFMTMKKVHQVMVIHGKSVLRTYSPITLQDNVNKGFNRMLIIVTSDMDKLSSDLLHKEIRISIVALIILILGGLMIIAVGRYIKNQGKVVDDVQTMYVQNIDSLYTTVKEYRHDFINHIFALSGLARIKKYDEMESYLHTLSQVSGVLKEIIDIPIPAFNGLIQAKAAQALERDIHFNYDFKGFEQLNLEMMKITDLVRIAGNLLDNAFYAVQECDKGERTVSITAKVEQRTLTLRVMNNGDPISNELCERIFEQGFTTKPRTKNSGLGLSIVKKIIEEYNGHIQVESHEELTSFQIDIPLSQKEILLGIA